MIEALRDGGQDGFLGDFSFNENGDPTLATGAVVGFTIFRGEEQLEVETVFSPDEEVVEGRPYGLSGAAAVSEGVAPLPPSSSPAYPRSARTEPSTSGATR